MKINGYVKNLIKRRERLAIDLAIACKNLDHYLDNNGIEVDDGDAHGGTEIYTDPTGSAKRICEAILRR